MVDLHCHIVPGVDDGARDIETALAMIRQAREVGVTAILTTPHIRSHPAERTTHDEHRRAFDRLLQAQQASDVTDVQLVLSGEVRVTGDAPQIWGDNTFTYGESGKHILLEMPSQEVPVYFSQTLFEYRLRGVTPIVAHPERNAGVLNRPEYAIEFVRQGAHLQLTTSSINGELGPTIELAAHEMLRAGIVSFIASDAHNLDIRSFRSWRTTRETMAGMELENWQSIFDAASTTNPTAVLEGMPLEPLEVDSTAEDKFLTSFSSAVEGRQTKRKRFFFF